MTRCQHPRAKTVKYTPGDVFVNCYCPECDQGWCGSVNAYHTRFGRLQKPPQWVTAALEREAALREASQ